MSITVALAGLAAGVRAEDAPPPRPPPARPVIPPPPASPTPGAAADRVLDAVRANDDAALAKLAAALDPDPFLVASRLQRRRIDATSRGSAEAAEALAASSAFAAAAAMAHAFLAPLPPLVSRWASLGDEDDARERRLWKALESALGAIARSAPADAEQAYAESAADVLAAPWSVTAIVLRTLAARARIAAADRDGAVAAYRALADAAAAIGWRAREADAAAAEAATEFGRTRFAAAVVAFRREVALREAIGDRTRLADAVGNLAAALGSTGAFDEALAALERCRALRVELSDAQGAAKTSADIALSFWERGAFAEAMRRFEAARVEAVAAKATRALSLIDANFPLVLQAVGRIPEALDGFERALADAEERGDRDRVILLLGNVGAMQRLLHDDERALATLARAETLAEAAGRRETVADASLNASAVLRHQWRLAEALPRAERALEIYESLGMGAKSTLALSDLGAILSGLGRYGEAMTRLEAARRGAAARGDHRTVALAASAIAIAKHRSGAADALSALTDALERTRAVGDPFQVAFLLRWRMDALAKAGRLDDARADADEAVDVLVRAGADYGEGEETFATHELWRTGMAALSIASTIALRAGLATDAESTARRERANAAAFRAMEAIRGLRVARALGNARATLAAHAPADAVAAREEARRRLSLAQVDLASRAATGGGDLASIRAARASVDAAYAELERTGARLHREAARAAQWAIPRPITIDDARSVLPKDTVLVEYTVGTDLYGAVVVTSERAALRVIGASEAMVSRVDAYIQAAASDDASESALGERLYADLIAPLGPDVENAKRVVIVPDGPLCFLPFEALVRRAPASTPDAAAAERLVERTEVVYAPSATVLAVLLGGPPRAGGGVVAIGDPIYPAEARAAVGAAGPPVLALRGLESRGLATLTRIPATGDEVRSIAGLFPEGHATVLVRERASLAEALAALGRAGPRTALHVACHGHVDDERPRLSGLVLGGGEMLTVDRVGDLDLSTTDLVVLSACETARGTHREGEGVIGLVRAFFLAGASRVVASDWKVSDSSTKTLMTAFYEGMRKEGLAPAAALRKAKLSMMKAGASAYRWAPFALWGRND